MEYVITKNFGIADLHQLKVAKRYGAYLSFEKLFGMEPDEVTAEVTKSALRGRGGAGFPVGPKWSSVPKETGRPVYLIVNADEGEPGTFKDRTILERDPHLIIEGMIIAAHAISAKAIFVYFRGEYARQWRRFSDALSQTKAAGFFSSDKFKCDVIIHKGAGVYICGEETALISSIEGRRGMPREKPPYPAERGLFGCPTVVNNMETIASLPFIIRRGAEEYRKIGTESSAGTKLVSVCGHVEKPGVYEIEMGLPVSTFLATYAGGTLKGRKLKALIPGGTSVPVLTAGEALGARIDFESIEAAGSSLGSGGMIVVDETACMVRLLADIAKFYADGSCGRCSPCREGTVWMKKIIGRMESGMGRRGDADLLLDIADGMRGRAICPLADTPVAPVKSFVTKFRGEFEEHIKRGRCTMV